jgi:hypothetical protein
MQYVLLRSPLITLVFFFRKNAVVVLCGLFVFRHEYWHVAIFCFLFRSLFVAWRFDQFVARDAVACTHEA